MGTKKKKLPAEPEVRWGMRMVDTPVGRFWLVARTDRTLRDGRLDPQIGDHRLAASAEDHRAPRRFGSPTAGQRERVGDGHGGIHVVEARLHDLAQHAHAHHHGELDGGRNDRLAELTKNAVHVLPDAAQSLEDVEWLREEVLALGGEASIIPVSSMSETD